MLIVSDLGIWWKTFLRAGQQKCSTNTAAIVGGVLGGLIGLTIIIALSVALGVSDHNNIIIVGKGLSPVLVQFLVIGIWTKQEGYPLPH